MNFSENSASKIIDKIRETRINKKISIVKLSVESGISRSHLYYIETKKISPTLDTLIKITKVLDINLKDLFE